MTSERKFNPDDPRSDLADNMRALVRDSDGDRDPYIPDSGLPMSTYDRDEALSQVASELAEQGFPNLLPHGDLSEATDSRIQNPWIIRAKAAGIAATGFAIGWVSSEVYEEVTDNNVDSVTKLSGSLLAGALVSAGASIVLICRVSQQD